jgi:urate oxidase
MAIKLGENSYGSSRIRLLRVSKQQGRHDVREIALSVRFEGDFQAAHVLGDNRKILPADTMKNTVYALARQHSIEPVENFGLHLIEHFLTYNPQVTRVIIEASENTWVRVPYGGKLHASAFALAGEQEHTCFLSGTREGIQVRAGIQNLVVLKTSNSTFKDFKKDPYTTLQEERDRILSIIINADWLYTEDDAEFGPLWHAVRKMLLETVAEHHSQSLQHSLYAMGDAILGNFENISEIHLSLPSRHYYLADLAALGMDNPSTVFLPADESEAAIEATLTKTAI